MSFLLGV